MGAIPTKYRGIVYRSRLEARWAAFMNNINWEHTYEPIDGDGYIPDFIIHGGRPFYLEVKPAATIREYQEPEKKTDRGLRDDRDILIVGLSPFMTLTENNINYTWGHVAGWFGEQTCWDRPYGGRSWDTGEWMRCNMCNGIAIYHTLMSFGGRPCWCASGGDHHMDEAPRQLMESFWADACNDVRWRGRAA